MVTDNGRIGTPNMPDYRDLAKRATHLTASPDVCGRVRALLDESDASVTQIAEVIACDPVLTSQVLKIAGARGSTLGDEEDSLEDAIRVVGLDDVRGIVLASVVRDAFEGVPADLADPTDFWYHSIFCGLAAAILARRCHLHQPDRLFTAGLLHDIGQLPIYEQLPELARGVLERAGRPEQYRYRAEQELIGLTHAQVGAELMRQWGLPASLWEPVEFHHEPQQASLFPTEAAIVHIATNVANLMEPSWKMSADPGTIRRSINPNAWLITGLSENDLQPTLDEVVLRSCDVMEIIAPDAMTLF